MTPCKWWPTSATQSATAPERRRRGGHLVGATGISNNPAAGTLGRLLGVSAWPTRSSSATSAPPAWSTPPTSPCSTRSWRARRDQIPTIPTGLPITAYGPDPALSLPATLQATPGGTVVVPVNIDTARPDGSTGATEAILALRYDPQVFSVSAADVQLGSLTGSGWQLTTAVNAQTGEIGIDLFGSSPIQTTAGGSLVTIKVGSEPEAGGEGAVGSNATAALSLAPISLVTQVNPTGSREFRTTLSDGQGALVIDICRPALCLRWAGNGGTLMLRCWAATQNTAAAVPLGGAPFAACHLPDCCTRRCGIGALVQSGFDQPMPLLHPDGNDGSQWGPSTHPQSPEYAKQWDDCLACLARLHPNVGGLWDKLDSPVAEPGI